MEFRIINIPLVTLSVNLKLFYFMDFILEENAHGLALKFSQNHGNLENYKHGTVK